MRISLLLLTICSVCLAASEWKVEKQNHFFILKKESKFYQIISSGGKPKFLEEKKLNENFSVLIYKSGEAGTSQIVVIERALLFKDGKYLEDVPYRYYDKTKGPKSSHDPTWKISPEKITIKDNISNKNWNF